MVLNPVSPWREQKKHSLMQLWIPLRMWSPCHLVAITEGAKEGPPEQLPLFPSSTADNGPEPCVAIEGAEETLADAVVDPTENVEPVSLTTADEKEGGEQPEWAEGGGALQVDLLHEKTEDGPETVT
ncbi:UNVERIFIED_CONTAM: hypothetical protein FKN15_037649 [Acipenser sinensis]